jgi:hypothetical protein
MYGGIDQLVDTYKVNPNPLQERVQQAQQQAQQKMLQQGQQGQPSNEIPPDLEEAIALQKIAELHQGAQNQQAMQAGGAQPSVVAKLHQMLGTMRQQAQPQGEPVMAAHGGSIDQLMSNLGRHYAGGGIVAFSGQDGSKVPSEAELEAQRKADREKIDALARTLGETGGEYAGKSMAALADIASLIPRGLAGAADTAVIRPLRALGANIGYLSPELTPGNQSSDTMTPFYDRYIRAKEASGETPAPTPTPTETKNSTAASESPEVQKLKALAAAKAQTGVNTNPALQPKPPMPVTNAPAAPRPTVVNPGIGGGPAKPAAETMSPMEKIIQDSIMKTMGQDPDEVRRKAIEANRQAMGIDTLLKPAQDRAAAREEQIKQIQASRQPLWITALQNAGNKPGKVAQVLNNMATGVSTTKQGYDTENLKFLDELNSLYGSIDKAKIEGRYKDVAAGEAAVKDLINAQGHAETAGTSLLNKQATLAQTKQIADDNRKSREMIAASNLEATKAKRLQDQSNFLANLEVKHAALLNNDKDYQGMIKQKQFLELQMTVTQNEANRAKLAEQLDTQQAKMASYAASKVGSGMTAGAANIPPPPQGAVREVKKS